LKLYTLLLLSYEEQKSSCGVVVMCQLSSEGRAMPGPGGVLCPLGTQVSFIGATMPRDLENILEDVVPVSTVFLGFFP